MTILKTRIYGDLKNSQISLYIDQYSYELYNEIDGE